MVLSNKDKLKNIRLKVLSKYIITPIVLLCSLSPIYAGTIDDVRELLGRERVDKRFTDAEILEVTRNYMLAEKNNLIAEMFAIGENIPMGNYEVDKIQLITVIDRKRDELNKAYSTGESLDIVLKLKTELDTLMSEVSRLKEVGYDVSVSFEPNPYTEEYIEIQNMVKELGEHYDVGDIGIDLKSPVLSSFVITSPFGTRLDPFTGEASIHNALDLAAKHREPVLAQWNGIVTQAYLSETGGNMVRIAHGEDMETTYMHMDELNVKAGDYINQYDVIGYAGSTGRSTGTHLHFEVKIDGIPVNPLMLYGTNGLNSLKTWLSLHPNELEDTTFINKIKDKPEDFKSEVEEIVNKGYQSYVRPNYRRGVETKELSYKESMLLKDTLVEEQPSTLYTEDGKKVVEMKLPEDYIVPLPGIPYLDDNLKDEDNSNVNENDIEDFEEYGKIHVLDDLESDLEDKDEEETETKSFHLKTFYTYD